jgi:hypothetical protein
MVIASAERVAARPGGDAAGSAAPGNSRDPCRPATATANRQSRYGTASTRRLAPCRREGALIASQRLRSRAMVLDAAWASRAYGGRRPHPAMPVSTARAW